MILKIINFSTSLLSVKWPILNQSKKNLKIKLLSNQTVCSSYFFFYYRYQGLNCQRPGSCLTYFFFFSFIHVLGTILRINECQMRIFHSFIHRASVVYIRYRNTYATHTHTSNTHRIHNMCVCVCIAIYDLIWPSSENISLCT